MRISDWSSDVCSSDLLRIADGQMFENAYSGATGLVTARRNAGGRSSTLGFFAEDDWTLGNLVLTGGARVDRWTITGGFFTERDPAGAIATKLGRASCRERVCQCV